MEEALHRQPRVLLSRLPLPPGIVPHWVVPRSGKAGRKQAKCPVPEGTPRMEETSSRDNIPPKKRKKMVVCQVLKHSKTLGKGKLMGDGAAAGSSRQHVGSSKRRACHGNNVPTRRSRTLGDEQSAPHPPDHC